MTIRPILPHSGTSRDFEFAVVTRSPHGGSRAEYGVEFVSPAAGQQATILGNVHRLLAAQLARKAADKSSS